MSRIPPAITSMEWSARTKRTVALLTIVSLAFFIWLVRETLPIVIVAVVIAYLLHPVVAFFQKRILAIIPMGQGMRRTLSIVITFIWVLILFSILLLVVLPLLFTQLQEFGRSIPRILQSFEPQLEAILSEPITFQGEPILIDGEPFVPIERIEAATGTGDVGELLQLDNIDIVGTIQSFLGSVGSLTGPAFSVVGNAFATIVNITFLVVMIFYLLKDGSKFSKTIVRVAPETYRGDVSRLLYELRMVWDAYLRGQILLCFVMGILVYIAAELIGLPNAPILGLLAGILEFIPNLGPLLALIPAAFLALVSQSTTIPVLEGFWFMVTVIVIWTLLQNLEALFLVPRIMGDSLNLHPFVVIVAVIMGASLAGPLGIILAAPFVASARVIGEYLYGKLFDQAPFPDSRSDDNPSIQLPSWLNRIFHNQSSEDKPSQSTATEA